MTFCLSDAVARRVASRRQAAAEDEMLGLAAENDPLPDRGSCLLSDPKAASIIENTLLHFQGERYAMSAWCVMPNHVHVVVTPASDHRLNSILHSWKSYSANEINKLLGRSGNLWETEAFDHLVRDGRSFDKFVAYSENNSVSAGLCKRPEVWPFSCARFHSLRE